MDPTNPTGIQLDGTIPGKPPGEQSPSIDAAVLLPNVNDKFAGKAPHLGAIEFGKPLPHYGPR